MAACYGLDSDSDASSEDKSLPKITHNRRFRKPIFGSSLLLPKPVTTTESKKQSQKSLASEVGEVKSTRIDFSDSDLNDFVTGDTPPAPKRAGKCVRKWHSDRRLANAAGDLHASMKVTGGTSKTSSTAKKVLYSNSPTLGVRINNVQSGDFTALSPKKSNMTLTKKVSILEKGKSTSSLGSTWENDNLIPLKVPKTLSVRQNEFPLKAIPDSDDVDTSDSELQTQFSQKKIEEFRKQLTARQNRHKANQDHSQEVRVEISSEDEDIPSLPLKSRLTSTILGKSSTTHVPDSQVGSLGEMRQSLQGRHSFTKGVSRQISRPSNSKRPKKSIETSFGAQKNQQRIELESNSDGSQSEEIVEQKVVPRVSDQKLIKVKLEKEDILTTKRKYCCKATCLRKLGAKIIRETRENYFRQSTQHRPSSLQWLVQTREDERKGDECVNRDTQKYSRGKFKIKGVSVCRKAFKAVFCISNNMLQRLQDPSSGSLYSPRMGGKPLSNTSCVVIAWMKNFFQTHCESLPNKDIVHLPDNYSKLEVWNLYKSTYGTLDIDSKVGYRRWCKLWSSNFSHVKIPVVNRFSVCADCEEFKSIREKAVTPDEKRKIIFNIFDILFSTFVSFQIRYHAIMKSYFPFVFQRKETCCLQSIGINNLLKD